MKMTVRSSPRAHACADVEDAFTLGELLVVIAACVLLLITILPAMGRTKDNRRGAVCSNNLRQMGVALGMYTAENRDYLAAPNWDGGNATAPGWLYSGTVPRPSGYTNLADAYKGGRWFQYLRTPATYICPADLEDVNRSTRNNQLSTYVMNGAVCNYGFLTGTRKVTDVWSPNCYLLWEPNFSGDEFVYNDASANPSPNAMPAETPGQLHAPGRAEILTLSGGVAFQSITNFIKETRVPANMSLAIW